MTFAVLLALVPAAWGQQEQAPLSLTGNVGAGYSSQESGNLSGSSPITSVDAELSGYWRHPRILLFDFAPVLTFGNSVASGIDLTNRGKGFTASTTLLGGSSFPLTVSYSRFSHQFPGFSTSGNILGGLATSLSTSVLGVDWGLYWGKLPPISLHYSQGGSDSELPDSLGSSSTNHRAFSASTTYSLAGWRMDAGYSRNRTDATRLNLFDLSGPAQSERSHAEDLHASAQHSLPLQSNLSLSGGRRKWDDSTFGFQTDSSYNFGRAVANSHPISRLDLNLNAGYTSDESAAEIQQALGLQGAVPGGAILAGPPSLTFSSGRAVDVGGGGRFRLPKGFSASADASVGKFSNALSAGGDTLLWDAGLDYVRRVRGSGMLSASYRYQHAETDVEFLNGTSTTRSLRAGFSSMFSHQLQLGGTMHFDQNLLESQTVSLPPSESPGRGYGFSINAARPLTARWRLSGDFGLDNSVTDFPLHFESKTKSFGIRAESSAWQLSLRRTYHDGLAVQVGNGLVFVNNPQNALLSPLGAVLSLNSNVQTTFLGSFQPGSKRLRISGSLARFGYDNKGLHVTDATLVNAVISYNLRRLRLQAGYFWSSTQAFALGTSPAFHRREIYFEVIRRFRIF